MKLHSATLMHFAYLLYISAYYGNGSYGCRPGIKSSNAITHKQGKNKQISM